MPITAPYNFVPLSDKVFTVEWADQISMDIPFIDGEDGIIELTITNHTPLFIGNKKDSGTTDNYSRHIVMPDGSRRYYIPGTTLKGCFRSVMEILSFARMNMYNKDSFGYRYFDTKQGAQYRNNIKNAKYCGWLKECDGEHYITPCSEGIRRIQHAIIKKLFPCFYKGEDHETAELKQRNIATLDNFFPIIEINDDSFNFIKNDIEFNVPHGKYQIVCTGHMNKKDIEYLFSDRTDYPIKISDDVFQQFNSVHKNTEYYGGKNGKGGFLKERLRKGLPIPVFFEKGKDGSVVTMGITANYRYPYTFSVEDMVQRAQAQLQGLDLPSAIFGHIEDHDSLRGRVSIGNAFANNTNIIPLAPVSGVLGQPKASYYPLYLKQEKNHELQNWDSISSQIAGRKRYRIIQGLNTMLLPQGNGNENVVTTMIPIPANNTFKCKIRIHNLRKMEIGAILSAITFNQTKEAFHNIGMAKSFGYGIITCHIDNLFGLSYSVDEYIQEFNKHISLFLHDNGSSISSEECLKMLVSIASPTHSEEDMKTMNFDTYEDYKKNTNKSSLSEEPIPFNIPIDELTIFKEHTMDTVDELCQKEEWDNALSKLESLKMALIKSNYDNSDVLERIGFVNRKIEAAAANEQLVEQREQFDTLMKSAQDFLANKESQKAKESVESALKIFPDDATAEELLILINNEILSIREKEGISAELTKLQANGSYAVKDFKVCQQKVEKWMKATSNTSLPESQFPALEEALLRLSSNSDRKEAKLWSDFSSVIWKTVTKWIGEDYAKQLYDKIMS